jgi:hypothetical protein
MQKYLHLHLLMTVNRCHEYVAEAPLLKLMNISSAPAVPALSLAIYLICKCLYVLGIEEKEIELDPPEPTVTVEMDS